MDHTCWSTLMLSPNLCVQTKTQKLGLSIILLLVLITSAPNSHFKLPPITATSFASQFPRFSQNSHPLKCILLLAYRRALEAWKDVKGLKILGNTSVDRLPVFSLVFTLGNKVSFYSYHLKIWQRLQCSVMNVSILYACNPSWFCPTY